MFIKKIAKSEYFPWFFFAFWLLFLLSVSVFRDSRLDENIYLADSVFISNLLREGEWIGNYGVGLHGFLSKLIIGCVFLLTGPSVFVATFFNVILAILSGVLFYKILHKNFKFTIIYSLLGVTLLFCSYQFLTYTTTFYRDIGALFCLLLVLNSILDKRNKFLIGLFLLLLLDAKEHVFYTVAPALIIWIGIESIWNNKGSYFFILRDFFLNGLKIFLPCLIFLILMFTTSIVPLNIYNANILGLTKNGIEIMISNFDLDVSTYNRDLASNPGIARAMPIIAIPQNITPFLSFLLSCINILLLYLGKILYPRTFSFLSVPFLILIPSVICAIRYLIICVKAKNTENVILPIIMFVFLAIYIFHASIGRYIIPVLPIIILFFLVFVKDLPFNKNSIKWILLITMLAILGGLFFEYSYILVKVLINVFLFLILLFICFKKEVKNNLKYLFLIFICFFSIGTSLFASYKHGQIGGYLLYGYNRECNNIVSLVNEDEKIWINDIGWDKLPFILRNEELGTSEWRWSLQEWIPKKKFLKNRVNTRTFNFYWYGLDDFKDKLYENNIQKIVYVKLNKEGEKRYLLQDRLDLLSSADWLILNKAIEMRNKTIYIFTVK